MKCASPVFIQDPATGGILHVPCGRCIRCRINRAKMWSIRIMHEAKKWPSVSFVTLTYNDENLPVNGTLVKSDVQLFIKRFRKAIGPREIKYFIGGEYGDHGRRPHYHCILFGVGISDRPGLEQAWGKGHIHVGTATHDSACYVASYTLKKLSGPRAAEYTRRGVIPEFALMSRRPGIAANYVEDNKKFLKQNAFCIVKGKKVAMPRYYADKVFSDDEKHLLHAIRQEFHEEHFAELMKLANAEHGYQALDYEKGMRKQAAIDLQTQLDMKRRKL